MKVTRAIKLFFCFLAISILSNCSQKTEKRELFVDQFPVSKQLTSIPIGEIENSIPSQIMVEDSLLIILNSRGEKFFQVYNKSNMKSIAEFGTKGEGPEEFNSPEFSGQIVQEKWDKYYLIFDWKKLQVNLLNLKESIRLNSSVFKSIKLPNRLSRTFRLVYYSDSLIITVPGGDGDDPGRFQIFKDSILGTIGYLPDLPFKVHEDNRYPMYANVSSAIHPEKHKFVATATLLGQYDFFSFDGNYLHSTVVERDEGLRKAARAPTIFDEPVTFYHTQLIAKDSYIYSLYSTSTKEMKISKSKIHVLDWEGKPIKEYILDCSLLRFDLDLENDAIYGLSYSNDKEERIHIVKFLIE
tara:strand:+ start:169 stop:1233 length:1065 start_codon:yes stop_codon:yes gene_type:complete